MDLEEHKQKFDKVIDHLKIELSSIRTGRATPALIENIKVAAYEGGEAMSVVQLASISVPEARQLLVEPWDKSIIKNIEKAINESDLGLSVTNEGSSLRLTVPLMTDEMRQKITKLLNEKLETARISTRGVRDKVKEDINKQEKDKEISEDEKYKLIDKLDELVKKYNDQIKEQGENKEAEISV